MFRSKAINIIYNPEDNQPTNRKSGWVSGFSFALEHVLQFLEIEKPRIELVPLFEWEKTDIKKESIVVLVLSEKLIEELGRLEEPGRTITENEDKLHLIKVTKEPVREELMPLPLRKALSHDFFRVDEKNGITEYIEDFTKAEKGGYFWMKILDVGYKILNYHRESCTQKSQKIYLAETGQDLIQYRELLKRELERSGFEVLPNRKLLKSDNLTVGIEADLQECLLSIHLFGSDAGERIQKIDLTVMELENKLSAEYSSKYRSTDENDGQKFKRIIWLPGTFAPTNEKYKIFIQNLKRDAEAIKETDFLQGTFEGFKKFVKDTLVNNGGKIADQKDLKKSIKSIYLIYDKEDNKKGEQVSRYLKTLGYKINHLKLEDNPRNSRENHDNNLRTNDAFLIIISHQNLYWLNSMIKDILKAQGNFRKRSTLVKGILLYDGAMEMQERIEGIEDFLMLTEAGDDFKKSISPFVETIK